MATCTKSSSIASSSPSSEHQMDVYLKVMKTVALRVNKSGTIGDLKALFCEKEGISETLQEIFISGKRLKDEQKLICCGIRENSTLNLHVENSEVLKLFINIISKRKTVEIEAKIKDTVEALKSKICLKEGINLANQFSLFNAGTQFDDPRTLASLGIKTNSTLQLFANPRDVLSFSVKFLDGKLVKTEVKILFTVAEVKAFVSSIAGFCFGDHCLLYEGKELEDSKTLAYYGLKEDSLLRIVPRKLLICIKAWREKTGRLVKNSDKISDLKTLFCEKEGISENLNEIFFSGKNLIDCGVQENSTLNLHVEKSRVLKIFITIVSNLKTVWVEAKSKVTIEAIKLKICLSEGLDLSNQYSLFSAGTQLDDSRTLASLGIKENSTLLLFSDPRYVSSVSIEFPDGKIVKTAVKILSTVAEIKAFISSTIGFSFGEQSISYEGKQLEDSKILACYTLKEDSLIKIVPRKYQIFIKTWSGKSVTLDVQETNSINDVKQALFKKLNLDPVKYMNLVYGGKLLENYRDLASYGVKKQSTLTMIYCPRYVSRRTTLSNFAELDGVDHTLVAVSVLKKLIGKNWEIPVKNILLGSGLQLQDPYTMSFYDIHRDTVLIVCSEY